MTRTLLIALTFCAAWPASAAEKITKETLATGGEQRIYYLFVPESVGEKPAPLIITLHGSGRDGGILLEHWQGLAKREGIILAGPDSSNRQGWSMSVDGTGFLHALVEALKSKYPVDPRRVYLFGHSAGAIHGLHLAVLESEYFAAVAVHAGLIMEEYGPFAKQAARKVPIAMWVGTNDRFFPLASVRVTRDALVSLGFAARLTEINGHTHDYYGRSSQINKEAWAFLREQRLENDPRYQEYMIAR